VRRVREDWEWLGPSAHLSDLRRDPVLRQFPESSRNETCNSQRTSGYCFCSTGRTLAVLLSWWWLCWVL